MNDMKDIIARAERIAAGEEPVTQKVAIQVVLNVMAGMYGEFSPHIKQVPKNTTAIEVLRTRVMLGIGLTALASILAIAAAVAL